MKKTKHTTYGTPCNDPNCWCKKKINCYGCGNCAYCKGELPIIEDMINHPPHYAIPGTTLEALDVIKASLTEKEYKGYLRGNILKYHIRARIKGGDESLQKAHFYSKKLSELINERN